MMSGASNGDLPAVSSTQSGCRAGNRDLRVGKGMHGEGVRLHQGNRSKANYQCRCNLVILPQSVRHSVCAGNEKAGEDKRDGASASPLSGYPSSNRLWLQSVIGPSKGALKGVKGDTQKASKCRRQRGHPNIRAEQYLGLPPASRTRNHADERSVKFLLMRQSKPCGTRPAI